MIRFTKGNLLDANAEALINTVNTVGVMGKGIALMFKEAFPENYRQYEDACKRDEVQVGRMFVTERRQLMGPKWIINFPTKKHWRHPSRIEWIEEGLADLKRVILDRNIRSVAIPPLGSGNGGLSWDAVRPLVEQALRPLHDVDIVVYEPTESYQNVMKRSGVEALTPARALIADLVRRYWILGMECTLLEVQKLAYFLEIQIIRSGVENPLDLRFNANRYGPFANRLTHLLNTLDGSYLHCNKRLADAGPMDVIWFEDTKKDAVIAYLNSEAKDFLPALKATADIIDGFESPLGMELLSTVDWLVRYEGVEMETRAVRSGLRKWPAGPDAAERKMRIFDERLIGLAVDRIARMDKSPAGAGIQH